METFLFLITNFLVDIRNIKLVCRAWNHVLEMYDQDIVGDILNKDKASNTSMTLHEHMINAVRTNDIDIVLKVYRMSYKPILWDHLAFFIKDRRMYNLLKFRMSKRYRNLALLLITPDDKINTQRVSPTFAFFQTTKRVRDLTLAILNNDVKRVHTLKQEYQNMESHAQWKYGIFLKAFASEEICKILDVPNLYGKIKEKPMQLHEYPFPLPDEDVSTLIKYGRVDHLDLLIANGRLEIADISTIIQEKGLSLYPSLITYIERVSPYY